MVQILNKVELEVKKYSIEKREFRDAGYFGVFFKITNEKWSDWKAFSSSDELQLIATLKDQLELNKVNFRYKIEYRLIKNYD